MPEFPALSEGIEAEALDETLVEATVTDAFPDWSESATAEAAPPDPTPMRITVAWSIPSGLSTSGRTITIERSEDGGSWEVVVSGLAPGSSPYVDTFTGVEHDPLTGTVTSRRHRVSLVRAYDGVTVAEGVSLPLTTFDALCSP